MPRIEPESSLANKPDGRRRRNGVVWVLVLLAMALAVAVVVLAVLLSIKRSSPTPLPQTGLPAWPDPSISPLGVYQKAAVAADNGLCSEIGRDALILGGTAIDAAVATTICIGVMDAHSSGLGGGHFMTVYNRTTKKCEIFDGREMAPGAATPTMYVNKTGASTRGELASLRQAWVAGGRRPWASLLQPTISLLTRGYPVSPALAKALKVKEKDIRAEPTMSIFINPATNRVFKEGEIMKRPTLANTLSQLANSSDPIKLFSNGSLAQTIADEFRLNKGIITSQDLANYKVERRQPIYSTLPDGLTVCGPPPPSSAAVTASIINFLGVSSQYASLIFGYNLTPQKNLSTVPENILTYHRMVESMKFGYAVRSKMGDSSQGPGNLTLAANITSDAYANRVRSLITDRAHKPAYYGGGFSTSDHGTSHISVLDSEGNAVSITSTINLYFGSMRRSEKTGIIWNDEMDDFSTPGLNNAFGYPPSPSNFIYPRKRPMSSMSPIVMFDRTSGQVRLVVGAAGGSRIISSTAYVSLRALFFNETIKQAIDAPRLHNQLLPPITWADPGYPQVYFDGLKADGQNMTYQPVGSVCTGIQVKSGNIYANSDYRKGSSSFSAGY